MSLRQEHSTHTRIVLHLIYNIEVILYLQVQRRGLSIPLHYFQYQEQSLGPQTPN